MVLHFFLPCYFGQLLHDQHKELNFSLYQAAWISQDESFKKLARIVMENFKKDEKVAAFGVFKVDLETFTTVMNTSFSLYAVLKSF